MNWSTNFEIITSLPQIKKELEIPIIDNWPRKVDAIIIGDLAVHKNTNGVWWSVTHVPTLSSFDKALPIAGYIKKEQILNWCEQVQQNLKPDWELLRTLTPLTYSDQNDEIHECKKRILEMCRAVEIN